VKVLRDDEWRSADLGGRSVAIVASAAEVGWILPSIVGLAASVKIFQSSPDWIAPTRLPLPGRFRRAAARLHLRATVADPWVRRQLTPRDGSGRVAVRPGFYAALEDPTCKLYTWPVYAVTEHGLRSAEGVEHRVDVVILGNGVQIAGSAIREERIA
jgi:cation diffusion facilitator CzcD-associated flavoprotein CzcO